MMKKLPTDDHEQLEEVANKLANILIEYNCFIEYDYEMNKVILVDKDNKAFLDFTPEEK